MFRPSLTAIFCGLFIAYMVHSMLSMVKLFIPPSCEADKVNDPSCLRTTLKTGEESLRFLVLTTVQNKPRVDKDLVYSDYFDVKDLNVDSSKNFKITLPKKVREQNGTLYLAVFSIPLDKETKNADVKSKWQELMRHPKMTYSLVPLTTYHIPEAETFNLLGANGEEADQQKRKEKKASDEKPIVHIKSKMVLNVMTDRVDLPIEDIPGEMYPLIRAYQPSLKSKQEEYLPIVYVNELSQRTRDLVRVNVTSESTEIEITYSPISFGKLRLFIQFANALGSMQSLGFTHKDTDEVKGIFADTNLVLLLVTFGVSAIHLLFDFLAFKNDVAFWRSKRTMVGLSTRTVLWRAFSQTVVFFYLMDENTSLLVLIPSGIAAVIEVWKVTVAFKIKIDFGKSFFSIPRIKFGSDISDSEKETKQFDADAMSYLSYVLYPLCIGGAIYSLVYTPHKSWYSWTIQSLVNGVYAFGFLFMLPQLFVNYKLKSVAHLPWRSFMYKAFNTFIDDLFAFIITMPTAHRVACFRDDIVFLIYLYQRWLYPVDQTRIDCSGMIEETCQGENTEEIIGAGSLEKNGENQTKKQKPNKKKD